MTKVHVIGADNRSIYGDVLEQTFRLRHEIFVDERGWSDLARPDGREIDQFDDDAATYLVALDGEKVVGGMRLYPSLLPHMMTEVFGHLCADSVPRAPDIYEVTRYFVVKERRFGRTDCLLMAAVQEYCLGADISAMTAVVEMWWLPRWQQAGFVTRPLGLPTPIEGEDCLAVEIEIRADTLARVGRLAGVKGSALVRRNIPVSPAWIPLRTTS